MLSDDDSNDREVSDHTIALQFLPGRERVDESLDTVDMPTTGPTRYLTYKLNLHQHLLQRTLEHFDVLRRIEVPRRHANRVYRIGADF